MKIQVKKLGALEQAEFELGDMTIICGNNNTGKTYATYALFGFLSFWREAFSIRISEEKILQLLNEGTIELDLQDYIKNAQKILKQGCKAFTEQLPTVFASSGKYFSESEFMVDLDIRDIHPVKTYEKTIGAANTQIFSISKKTGSKNVNISLLVEKEKVKIPQNIIYRIIGDALKEIIFGHLFPHPFIASAERTGAAIFRKELNFARNRLLEQMSSMEKDINPFEFLTKVYSDYALPVKTNVDFTRQLEDVAKKDSFISKQHPEILNEFANIIGGEYLVTKNDELYYVPKGKRIKLTMDESSSAVRSLLDIGFYLLHVAQPRDLLMVDEPELNLHPENQRRVARLFARLVNLGIKIFITTHSDYIIKELNTLIMLNHDKKHLKLIMEKEGYCQEELLSAGKVRVYIAEEKLVCKEGNKRSSRCLTLVPADIDPELGIEARSFDITIDAMNRIQEAIIFSGEDV
ncbi:MAG: ATP-binding protein [Desulfobacterales bacterium]|jgi:ABC-type branched-subunit amino acid transport system ATPase component|nr:ATP-binding protein [Desulfobacterales bacterium]MDD3081614.1 ATP-binding protein [Desulfobacterales bacterium]MDD3949747.1 ATP-binding protein [Desulfobacterales bacterium]MDD4464446.1 ATP-binding protein [Desulfobacterales bacterium]MDY0378826.1 ATP-binding protein [Desulfobacterales bacterium]